MAITRKPFNAGRISLPCWGEARPWLINQYLSVAYAANKKGLGGTQEKIAFWGDCSKHIILAWLHKWLQPALYLEIGVDE